MEINILFLGNSHTYLHHMPRMIEFLAREAPCPCNVNTHQVVGKGVSLKWHSKNSQSLENIASRSWDYVVLQECSGGPASDPEAMSIAARQLDGLIRTRKSRTVFFMTWSKRDQPEMQTTIANAYIEISHELNALLAPAGLVWQQALKELPELAFYHQDGRHASALGTYLTACVFTHLFLGVSPGELPAGVTIDGREKVTLPKQIARTLQKIICKQIANIDKISA